VETAVYMGTDQRCDIRIDDGPVLRARIAAGVGQQRREVGERVSVMILPEHLRVMQRENVPIGEAAVATAATDPMAAAEATAALEEAR
jgi:hypothetical protein